MTKEMEKALLRLYNNDVKMVDDIKKLEKDVMEFYKCDEKTADEIMKGYGFNQ